LATAITAMGGTILTETTVDEINGAERTIRFNDDCAGFSSLVWAGNLHDLGRLLGEKLSHLEYLSTIFYNIVLRSRPRRNDQWIYYGDCDLQIVRVSIANNFAPYLIPEPWGGLIVEKTCRYQDKIWNNPAGLQSVIIDELMRVGLISSASDILSTMVEPVRDTYPVYHLNYRKGFSEIMATIKKCHPYITLLGRTGAFWYNNSDHSISLALKMARYLTGKETREPDKENIFSSEVH
jgi:protoporphyrinogen oxidase